MIKNQDLILFVSDDQGIQVNVKIEKETLWLNLNQINDNLYKKGFDDLKRSIKILTQTLINQSLVQEVGETALSIIEKYANT
ncbi:MAG: hypothetical protein HEEMFOPI_01419 [Holosporales bacterium]